MSTRVDGDVDEGFGPVADAVRAAVRAAGAAAGASCCVLVGSRTVVDVSSGAADASSGRPFGRSSLQLLHTATSGAVATTAAILVERGLLSLDEPVASYWPEFGTVGKEGTRVAALLNHAAAVPVIDEPINPRDLIAVAPVVEALARQAPLWAPGSAHGFHAVTFGWLVGELVRRLTGRTLGLFFANEVADRFGLEFWIGLPGALEWRVAPLIDAMGGASEGVDGRGDELTVRSLRWRATTLDGKLADSATLNTRLVHATEMPAVNGIATARGLAGMYAAAASGTLLRRATIETALASAVDGADLVLGSRTRFSLGFTLPTPEWPFLGPTSFGSIGIGNALGFGDLDRAVGFGYVTNRFSRGVLPPPGAADLIAVLGRCLG